MVVSEVEGSNRQFIGRLPRGAREGWERLRSEEVNPELVDRTGYSLFGRYWIHAPQKVV